MTQHAGTPGQGGSAGDRPRPRSGRPSGSAGFIRLRRMGRWLVTARGGMLGMVSRLAAVVMALAGLVLGGIGASNALPAFANGLGHGGANTGTTGGTTGTGNNHGPIQVK